MSSDTILDRVSAAVAAGRPRDAIQLLTAERPGITPPLAIVAAEAWAAVGAERRGTALLLLATRRHPTDRDLAVETARALLRRGAHVRARRVLEGHPTAAPVLVAVAWGASPPPVGGTLEADIDRALSSTTSTADLLALLERAPTSARLRIAVASRHLAEGAKDLARAVLRTGAKGREDARLDLALAFLAFDDGAFDEAAVVLARARARFPRLSRDASLTALVAMITVTAGRRADAISLLHGSSARGPVPALHALLTAPTQAPATTTTMRAAPAAPTTTVPAPTVPALPAMPAVAALPPRAPAASPPSVAPAAPAATTVSSVGVPPVALQAPPPAVPPPPPAVPTVAAVASAMPPVAAPTATLPAVPPPPPAMPTVAALASAMPPLPAAEATVPTATATPTVEPAQATPPTATATPTVKPAQATPPAPPTATATATPTVEPAEATPPTPPTATPTVEPAQATPPTPTPTTPPTTSELAQAATATAAPATATVATTREPQGAASATTTGEPQGAASTTSTGTDALPTTAKGPSPTWRRPHERVVDEPRGSPVAAIAVVALVLVTLGLVAVPRLRSTPPVVDAGPADVEAAAPSRTTEPTGFAARLTTCGLKVEPWVDVGIAPSAWAIAAAAGRWEDRPISVGRRPVPVNADIVPGIRVLPARSGGRVDPVVVVDPEATRVLGLGLQATSPTDRPTVKDVVGSVAFGSAIPRPCELAEAGSTCVVGTGSCEQLQFHVHGICPAASATTAGLPGCALDVVYIVDPAAPAKVIAP